MEESKDTHPDKERSEIRIKKRKYDDFEDPPKIRLRKLKDDNLKPRKQQRTRESQLTAEETGIDESASLVKRETSEKKSPYRKLEFPASDVARSQEGSPPKMLQGQGSEPSSKDKKSSTAPSKLFGSQKSSERKLTLAQRELSEERPLSWRGIKQKLTSTTPLEQKSPSLTSTSEPVAVSILPKIFISPGFLSSPSVPLNLPTSSTPMKKSSDDSLSGFERQIKPLIVAKKMYLASLVGLHKLILSLDQSTSTPDSSPHPAISSNHSLVIDILEQKNKINKIRRQLIVSNKLDREKIDARLYPQKQEEDKIIREIRAKGFGDLLSVGSGLSSVFQNFSLSLSLPLSSSSTSNSSSSLSSSTSSSEDAESLSGLNSNPFKGKTRSS